MSTDYMSGQTVSDHDLTLAIPGDLGGVRARLIEAVQKLGYKVLGEQPIYAKRGSQGAACWECSLNTLDYPTSLNISLKQVNDLSVLATFNYEVRSYMRMTKGDQQTLAREAEAIVALASDRLTIASCRACGTQITDESHFCRRCGAPLVLDVPELEVLRLTRHARGSYHNIVGGLFMLLLTGVALTIVFFLTGVRFTGASLAVLIPLAYALYLLFLGSWQLHYTLNTKAAKNATTTNAGARVGASVTTALPRVPANLSITEGTTEFLTVNSETRQPEPVRRRNHNTAELDNDRLM